METAVDTSRRSARNDGARGDLFDVLLRWAHRVLNPPTPAPARARKGDRRRIRDRVPL